ncbi:hypothetical protein [Alteromonas halophila]|uniref:Uncharacterized protein n=1 Tax=Alteromonas halophila TaxID=516698 RepID=A0A918JD11_9ALTE|nr:hypothetical protein [Alteromonas halophila]GGW73087.1 hypothetical protein GCM10007391_00780 [Alteromonas halophila]
MKISGLICAFAIMLGGCAQTSPRFEQAVAEHADGLSAQTIFNDTFSRHGGDYLTRLQDVNVAIDGEWHFLITQIQPDVTDEGYRQRSEERVLVSPRIYAALYAGPAGTKQVYRSAEQVNVAYNGEQTNDSRKNAATALTADAFYLFTLGPLGLSERVDSWQRLEDKTWKGRSYYRINGELTPGIGFSQRDHITLWVDKETRLTFRLHITLEGFESTKGAHVDTTFLAYTQLGEFTLPTHFFERVAGPIKIDAHEWWYTGIDINRGLDESDLSISGWSEGATESAASFSPPQR